MEVEPEAAGEDDVGLLCEDGEGEDEEAGAWAIGEPDPPGAAAGSQVAPAQSSAVAAPRPVCSMDRLMAIRLIYGSRPPKVAAFAASSAAAAQPM